jgi:dihydrofolate reductase
MKVSLIVAKAENEAIGKDNDLIWHLRDDMRYFSNITKGHHVIMGRMNYDSIPDKYCPLPDRTNIIVTRNPNFEAEDCVVVNSIKDGLEVAKKNGDVEAFIIGGGQIYKTSLDENLLDKLYITYVHHEFEADVFFPKYDKSIWKKTSEIFHPKDEKHAYSFSYVTYEKK